jgi:hypothetical protein
MGIDGQPNHISDSDKSSAAVRSGIKVALTPNMPSGYLGPAWSIVDRLRLWGL